MNPPGQMCVEMNTQLGLWAPKPNFSPKAWALASLLPSHTPLWPPPIPILVSRWGSTLLYFLVKGDLRQKRRQKI